MRKGDYIKIAEMISNTLKDLSFIEPYKIIVKKMIIENFNNGLKFDNYMFDSEKFEDKINEFSRL